MLQLNNPVLVRASFDRPNLYLKVSEIPSITFNKKSKTCTKKMPKEELAISWIKKYPNEKIIIYTNSRKDAEELSIELNKIVKNCSDAYHAGLSKGLRESIQSKFMDGEVKVIVSTIAFGMGIDQTVKVVIIFGCPSSIEEYYQQIGRGGRDGKHCETVLYFDYSNFIIAKYMMKDIKIKYPMLYKCKLNNLNKISKFAFLNTCRRKYILEYFDELCDFFTCENCDNCCENELVDMTDKFWSIIMKPGAQLISVANEIRNKYLTETNNGKVVELDLVDPLWKWKVYILENKITKDNIPPKLRLKIPKKFVKVDKPISEKSFDEKISLYEKLL
jgi:superfamily II DNA helicase RecQ